MGPDSRHPLMFPYFVSFLNMQFIPQIPDLSNTNDPNVPRPTTIRPYLPLATSSARQLLIQLNSLLIIIYFQVYWFCFIIILFHLFIIVVVTVVGIPVLAIYCIILPPQLNFHLTIYIKN